jgi:hypothetical protein
MAIVLDGSTGISSIGTLTGVTSISSTTADTAVILQDSSSNSNTCRAWVNFNGTSTVAIRADFNVTSITDNGTGDYTVNFSVAMPDANYAQAINAGVSGATLGLDVGNLAAIAPTTSAFRFCLRNSSSGAAIDTTYASVSIFR